MTEELHPNWRALATVHLPLKRFVREGVAEAETARDNEKHRVESGSGTQVRSFYEKLIARSEKRVIYKKHEHTVPIKCEKTEQRKPFDRNKFFCYATNNRADELKQFDYGDNDNLNCTDDFGWTALMMAACEGAIDAVQALLDLGADRSLTDKRGNTASDLARKKGHHTVEMILQKTIKTTIQTDGDDLDCTETIEPFYCDLCKRTFSETSLRQHQSSTIHQFNVKSTLPPNKLLKFNIAPKNRGLRLMVKQGWDAESGLGPDSSGRLYPVKTVIRKQRTGLGIEQPAARITHFEAFDLRATQRHSSDYYKKKPRNRNDIQREKKRDWKRERRLRHELS